jgi:hypothetical protein
MDVSYVPKIGDWVAWPWLSGVAEGRVIEIVYGRHEISSKGSRVVRNGTKQNPAVVMEHKSGNPVLKRASELIKPVDVKANPGPGQ